MYTSVFFDTFNFTLDTKCRLFFKLTVLYGLQLQMSVPPDKISEQLHSMQSCIGDVKVWATVNMFKLNDNKTEFMLVTSK